ncbi:MAG: phosphoribosylaminoimidazolesuccinocarboxamide synthase [Alistipes sp.]|nr:phosphoribosylaminoimidazolesuccinocarboxamide synthase [Alistipes sp.]
MKQMELLHEGKSKQFFKTDNDEHIIIRFKDDASAFYNIKYAKIENKGKMNCAISSALLGYLADNGVKSHFIEKIDDTAQLCHLVEHKQIEIIVRNVIAGSMAKRLGLEEGIVPENTIYDLCLCSKDLSDPLINDHHAVALGLATYDELKEIYAVSERINKLLTELFDKAGMRLIDFKIEFGRAANGELILADELTPDTCRIWDKTTGERMDKDRFRRDLGRVRETYEEVAKRVLNALNK